MMTDRELMQQALEALEAAPANTISRADRIQEAIAALRERLAQPDQWQGLTDDEIYLNTNNIDRGERGWAVKFARAIEAKLKEKNNGQ